MRVEAELVLPATKVQIWQFDLTASQNRVLRVTESYRLDLSLSQRLRSSMCFSDHWAPHRFEQPGKLFLLPPGETLRIRNAIGHEEAIICYLPVTRVREWLETDLEWTERRLEASLDIQSHSIANLLANLGEEARHPGFASEMLSEAMALQLAINLQRYYHTITESPAPGGLAPWRLRLIDERLHDSQQPPTLSELATLCKISVRQLSRGFKASRRVSIGEHVATMRTETAKRLLRDRGSIKLVAYEMGFASPSSFCYAFRKATGVAPSQYRDQLRQKN
jgi:AraC family transcriptional regulator